jgi:hypothetical protein
VEAELSPVQEPTPLPKTVALLVLEAQLNLNLATPKLALLTASGILGVNGATALKHVEVELALVQEPTSPLKTVALLVLEAQSNLKLATPLLAL